MSINTTDVHDSELTVEQKIQQLDKPYRDAKVLRHLYHEEGLSLPQCADRLGCGRETVRSWMKRHGIERRDQKDVAGRPRVERAYHKFEEGSGLERWSVADPDGTTAVGVHQLVAIADGADPREVFADDTHVHHRNKHSADNRPENLEVVTHTQHSRTHREDAYTHDSGLGCRVLKTAEREPEAASRGD